MITRPVWLREDAALLQLVAKPGARLAGFGHVREGARQLMGRAGARHVPIAGHCVVALGRPDPGITRYLCVLSR